MEFILCELSDSYISHVVGDITIFFWWFKSPCELDQKKLIALRGFESEILKESKLSSLGL